MNIDEALEEKLKSAVMKYLEKGRPNWEIPHTMACVNWMKELLKHEKGNPRILIPAIYLHDIGSADLFNESNLDHESQEKMKSEQMKRSAILSEKILNEIGWFSKEEIEKIVHLVGIHDELDKITATDGYLVFEADSLGMIDTDNVKSNFPKEDYIKFLDYFEKERAPRFRTKTGKKFLTKLLRGAKRYCEKKA